MVEKKKKKKLSKHDLDKVLAFRALAFISDSYLTGDSHFVLLNQVAYIRVTTSCLCNRDLDESGTLSHCTPHKGRDLGTVLEQIMFMKGKDGKTANRTGYVRIWVPKVPRVGNQEKGIEIGKQL